MQKKHRTTQLVHPPVQSEGGEADIFEKIKNAEPDFKQKYPSEGYCRVPGCGEYYRRHGKRGGYGMCRTHFREAKSFVDAEKTTWAKLHEEWPAPLAASPLSMEKLKIDETEFHNTVVNFIRNHGHGVWMLNPMRMAGIPDLLIVTKGGRVLFRELKDKEGSLESNQHERIAAMKKNGADVDVWRPGVLDDDAKKLLDDLREKPE